MIRKMANRGGDALDSTTGVVVNWNLPEMTVKCVQALVEDGLPPDRIVLVENGSTEESTAQLKQALPGCVLVRLEANLGYSRAANIGAKALEGEAYVFVNNDAFVHKPGSVGRLVANVQHNRIGIAVPRLLNEDLTLQPNVVPPTTPATALVQASGLGRLFPNEWQPRWSHHWNHDRSRAIFSATGTVLAVNRDLWTALGGWAERDLMFAEDNDLCARGIKQGWSIWFEADSEFVHLGNQSVRRQWSDARRSEMVARSHASMIKADLGRARAAAAILVLGAGSFLRSVYFMLRRDKAAVDSLRGSVRGYLRSLP